MTMTNRFNTLRERGATAWAARTAQERKFLTVGGVVIGLALLYLVLISPALDGRDRLHRSLPQLRQQSAEVQALAEQVQALAGQPAGAPSAAPGLVSREVLAASMTARGLDPAALSMSGELVTLQLSNVAFANLVAWLDEQRRDLRLEVQEAQFSAQDAQGHVNGSLTLRRTSSPSA